MLEIKRSHDRLIFNMGIPIPWKDGLYIETEPWFHFYLALWHPSPPHTELRKWESLGGNFLIKYLYFYCTQHSAVSIPALDVMAWVGGKINCGSLVSKMCIHDLITHWGPDNMAAIFQTTFSNAFFLMKMYWFQSRFHWSLFSRIQSTIFQHWFI